MPIFLGPLPIPTKPLGWQAKPTARVIKTIDAFATSFLVTQGLKSVIRSERPNHDDTRSFPSEHTAAAFSIATVQAIYDRKNAAYWYAGSTAIGIWRVASREHHVQDVLVGAAIGYYTAREVTHRRRGLLITPLFGNSGTGVSVTARF